MFMLIYKIKLKLKSLLFFDAVDQILAYLYGLRAIMFARTYSMQKLSQLEWLPALAIESGVT